MNARTIAKLVFLAGVAASPLSCLSCLVVANSWNPMLHAFLEPIQVQNTTDQQLFVTPIGWAGEARRAIPPIYTATSPPFPVLRERDILVSPGQTRTLVVDTDDVYLSELAVRSGPESEYRVVVINSDPLDATAARLESHEIVLSNWHELPQAPPLVVAALSGSPYDLRTWAIMAAGFLPPATMALAFRALRRARAAA